MTDERVVFQTMGTVVSLMMPGGIDPDLRAAVERVFSSMDERFSLYRAESEASRVSARTLPFGQTSAQYQQAYWLAHDWMVSTEGAFTPFRLDGTIDLNGVVKAMAIQAAADHLSEVADWCLNVGGDVVASGRPGLDREWVAGIVDPRDRTRLISQARLSDDLPALATSGTSERGEHIWRLATERQFVQVSVQADDIVTADVLATAIMSGGRDCLDRMCATHQIEVLAIDQSGALWATEAFRAAAGDQEGDSRPSRSLRPV